MYFMVRNNGIFLKLLVSVAFLCVCMCFLTVTAHFFLQEGLSAYPLNLHTILYTGAILIQYTGADQLWISWPWVNSFELSRRNTFCPPGTLFFFARRNKNAAPPSLHTILSTYRSRISSNFLTVGHFVRAPQAWDALHSVHTFFARRTLRSST